MKRGRMAWSKSVAGVIGSNEYMRSVQKHACNRIDVEDIGASTTGQDER